MHSMPAGVGLCLEDVDGKIKVAKVIRGSSAYEKAISAGDSLLRVDGVCVTGMTAENVAKNLIVGPIGTAVRIEVARENGRLKDTVRILLFRKVLNPDDLSPSNLGEVGDYQSTNALPLSHMPEIIDSTSINPSKGFSGSGPKPSAPSLILDRITRMATPQFHANGALKQGSHDNVYPGKFLHMRSQFSSARDRNLIYSCEDQKLAHRPGPTAPGAMSADAAVMTGVIFSAESHLLEAKQMHAATMINQQRLLRRAGACVSRWSVLAAMHREAALLRVGRQRRAHEILTASFAALAARTARSVRYAALLTTARSRQRVRLLVAACGAWMDAISTWGGPRSLVDVVGKAMGRRHQEDRARRHLAALAERRRESGTACAAYISWARFAARRRHLADAAAAIVATRAQWMARAALRALSRGAAATAAARHNAAVMQRNVQHGMAALTLDRLREHSGRSAGRLVALAALLAALERRLGRAEAAAALALISWCVAVAAIRRRRQAVIAAHTTIRRRAVAAVFGGLRAAVMRAQRGRQSAHAAAAHAACRAASAALRGLQWWADRRRLARAAESAGARVRRQLAAACGLEAFAAGVHAAGAGSAARGDGMAKLLASVRAAQLQMAAQAWRQCAAAEARRRAIFCVLSCWAQASVAADALRRLRRAALCRRIAAIGTRDLCRSRVRRASRAALWALSAAVARAQALSQAGQAARRLARAGTCCRALRIWGWAQGRCRRATAAAADRLVLLGEGWAQTAALAAMRVAAKASAAERGKRVAWAAGLALLCQRQWAARVAEPAWRAWLSMIGADMRLLLSRESRVALTAAAAAEAAAMDIRRLLRASLLQLGEWRRCIQTRRALSFGLAAALGEARARMLARALGGLQRAVLKQAAMRELKTDVGTLAGFNRMLQHFDAWHLRALRADAGQDCAAAPRCLRVASVRAADNMVRSGLVAVGRNDALAIVDLVKTVEATAMKPAGTDSCENSSSKTRIGVLPEFRRACEAVLHRAESIQRHSAHWQGLRASQHVRAWFAAENAERKRISSSKALIVNTRCARLLATFYRNWKAWTTGSKWLSSCKIFVTKQNSRHVLERFVRAWCDAASWAKASRHRYLCLKIISRVFHEWQELLFLSLFRNKVQVFGLTCVPISTVGAAWSIWRRCVEYSRLQYSLSFQKEHRLVEFFAGKPSSSKQMMHALTLVFEMWIVCLEKARRIFAYGENRGLTKRCAIFMGWSNLKIFRRKISLWHNSMAVKRNRDYCRQILEAWILLFNHNHSSIHSQILSLCDKIELNTITLLNQIILKWAAYHIIMCWAKKKFMKRSKALLLDVMASWTLCTCARLYLSKKEDAIRLFISKNLLMRGLFLWYHFTAVSRRALSLASNRNMQLMIGAMIKWYKFIRIEALYAKALTKMCLEWIARWRAYSKFNKRIQSIQQLSCMQWDERILQFSSAAWIQNFLARKRREIIFEEISRRHSSLVCTRVFKAWISKFQYTQYISLIERKISLFGIGTLLSRIILTWSSTTKEKFSSGLYFDILVILSETSRKKASLALSIWSLWSEIERHKFEVLQESQKELKRKILTKYMERLVMFIIKRKYSDRLYELNQRKFMLAFLHSWSKRAKVLNVVERKYFQVMSLHGSLCLLEWNEGCRQAIQRTAKAVSLWIYEIERTVIPPTVENLSGSETASSDQDNRLNPQFSCFDLEGLQPEEKIVSHDSRYSCKTMRDEPGNGLDCMSDAEKSKEHCENSHALNKRYAIEFSKLRQLLHEWNFRMIQTKYFFAAYTRLRAERNNRLCCEWFRLHSEQSKSGTALLMACFFSQLASAVRFSKEHRTDDKIKSPYSSLLAWFSVSQSREMNFVKMKTLVIYAWLEYQLQQTFLKSLLFKNTTSCFRTVFKAWARLHCSLDLICTSFFANKCKSWVLTCWFDAIRNIDISERRLSKIGQGMYASSDVFKVGDKDSLWTKWEETNYGQNDPGMIDQSAVSVIWTKSSDVLGQCEAQENDNEIECPFKKNGFAETVCEDVSGFKVTSQMSHNSNLPIIAGDLPDAACLCIRIDENDSEHAKKMRASHRRSKFLKDHIRSSCTDAVMADVGHGGISFDLVNHSNRNLVCSTVAYDNVHGTKTHSMNGLESDILGSERNTNIDCALISRAEILLQRYSAVLVFRQRREIFFLNLSLLKWQERALQHSRACDLLTRANEVHKYRVLVAWMQHHSVELSLQTSRMKYLEEIQMKAFVCWFYFLKIRRGEVLSRSTSS